MSNEQVVGMVKLEGDYAATILSYYLCGTAEPPKPSEISDKKFIREPTIPDKSYLNIGFDAEEYMNKVGNNIFLGSSLNQVGKWKLSLAPRR